MTNNYMREEVVEEKLKGLTNWVAAATLYNDQWTLFMHPDYPDAKCVVEEALEDLIKVFPRVEASAKESVLFEMNKYQDMIIKKLKEMVLESRNE
jgi:hypothetical protein